MRTWRWTMLFLLALVVVLLAAAVIQLSDIHDALKLLRERRSL